MAITYAQLLTKIRDYTEVDSTVLTDAIIDTFILDGEAQIYRECDGDYCREQATSNFVASNRYVQLPDNLLIVRSMQHITGAGVRTFLEKRDTSFISEYNSTDATGTPKYYAMWHRTNNIEYAVVAPLPNAADTVQINYIKYPEHLYSSDDAAVIPNKRTSTYLSTKASELLFYATMVNAYGFLKGPVDMYKLYKDKYNEEIQAFALEQTGRRRRGEYIDGTLRIPVPSPSPEQWRNLK
jgi:hypothetical protein|tara:strand:+ start:229 stop:945 length:717 start_codon:yes stop_codon:yes gene_type:complete